MPGDNSYSEAFRSSSSIDNSLGKLPCPEGASGLAVVIAGSWRRWTVRQARTPLSSGSGSFPALMASRYLAPGADELIPICYARWATNFRSQQRARTIGIGSHFELKGSKSLGSLVHETTAALALFAAV
jgi:hypothetical protein